MSTTERPHRTPDDQPWRSRGAARRHPAQRPGGHGEPPLRLVLDARPESVPVVRRALGELCRRLGMPDEGTAEVQLAATEACANVVMHAYGGRDDGTLEIDARRIGTTLEVVVRDHGRGVVPRTDSPGLGLGLPLIAVLATSVELRSEPGAPPTEVVLTFECGRLAE